MVATAVRRPIFLGSCTAGVPKTPSTLINERMSEPLRPQLPGQLSITPYASCGWSSSNLHQLTADDICLVSRASKHLFRTKRGSSSLTRQARLQPELLASFRTTQRTRRIILPLSLSLHTSSARVAASPKLRNDNCTHTRGARQSLPSGCFSPFLRREVTTPAR